MKAAIALRWGSALLGALPACAFAQSITLVDDTASLNLINDGSVNAGTADEWIVGGVDHLFQEEYFFRRTNSGEVTPLGGLGNISGTQLDANIAQFTYGAAGGVTVKIVYALVGATNTSDLLENVHVKNESSQTQYFELFEYDDFDLNGSSGDDTAFRNNENSISQFDGNVSVNAEVVTAPAADFTEVNGYSTLLDSMLSSGFGNLNTANSYFSGDATFAFQWVFQLNPGQSFIMSKDKLLVVPEPGTFLVLGGLAALVSRLRRRA